MYEARALSVGELLSNGSFRMPVFQRPYSWEQETAVQLFDDINAAMQSNEANCSRFEDYEPYFLGPIIIVSNGPSAPADLVDGQQRLVTLTSLLAVLRDKIKDQAYRTYLNQFIWRPPNPFHDTAPQPRLRVRDLDQDRFRALVQEDGATIDLPSAGETPAEDRLLTVVMKLKGDIGPVAENYLRAIARFVLDKCTVLQISAPSLATGYQVFRGINSRGQRLDPLDLVRAEIVGAPNAQALAIAEAWAEAEDVLGPDEMATYVEAVLQSVAPNQWDGNLASTFRRVIGDPQLGVVLRTRMAEFLRAHAAIEGGELEFGRDSGAINRRLLCIRKLPFDDWRAAVLLFMTRGPASSEFHKLLQRVEALALVLVLNSATKSDIRKRFSGYMRWLSDGNDPFAQTSPVAIRQAEYSQAIAILGGALKPLPRFTKFVLLRLNVEMSTQEIPPFFPSDVTIEHILPQKAVGEWLNAFPDQHERTTWTHRLGNLALLTHSINASAKNRPFSEKKRTMFGTENGNVFAITANVAAEHRWDLRTLRARHEKLIAIARSLMSPP